ncbi:MAG: InlB B-repeat-containing protein, partial [Lachnospiraceae bacterium]|nr:InlB B-repeat-containing protein [Lachnospiraceae bacterium]
ETGKEVTAEIELTAVYILREGSLLVSLSEEYPDGVIYDGTPKTPALEVKTSLAGIILTEGQDYTLVYENNIDAGTASVMLTGQNDYQGTVSFPFTVRKAAAPEAEETEVCYPYGREQKEQTFDIAGRFTKYGEITGYHVSYTENTEADRQIFPEAPYIADGILYYGTNAGKEGDLAKITTEVSFANYENAVVVLYVKFVDGEIVYTVTFDMGGHGTKILPLTVYGQGGLIDEPKRPEEKGYRFLGWYKDKDCTSLWDFNTDMVEDNMILYAGWLAVPQRDVTAGELYIQEIKNQTYTGSPIKPVLQVYAIAGDGKDIPLKQGKDYTIKFYNNTNADSVQEAGGISASGEEGDNGFTKSLPYAVITGKGNYTGTVYRNFHIDPAVIADKDSADPDGENNTTLAQGFTLKYKDQLTSGKKAQKPFTSVKYKKSMKLGRDYTLQLSALAAYDVQGNAFGEGAVIGTAGSTLQDTAAPAIPAGAKGTFLLTITGKGNYSGTVKKTVYVSDKSHLIKNASVALGKNQKKMEYAGENISLTLTPAYYDVSAKKYYGFKENAGGIVMDTKTELDKSNVFTVKFGKTYLKYGEDFEVDYVNNTAVGTATMRIKGIGEYSGTKNITFRITGTAFNAGNISIDGLQASMEYTGKALTQNGVVLKGINGIKSGKELVYRKDYTISYKNNLKKGTATMTFTAKPSSGYTGSFKKTFKINAIGLAAKGTSEDTVEILVITPAEDRIANESSVKDGNVAAGSADAGNANDSNEKDRIEYTENGIHFVGKVVYTKAGAKISDRIGLKNKEGFDLKEGTDYTVSYSSNKAVTTNTAVFLPAMTIKGRGNYTGELVITFEIGKASIEENKNLSVTTTAVAYNKAKAWEYEYRPKVKIMDGGQALSAQNDYDITYYSCGQDSLYDYFTNSRTLRPYAVITAKEEGNYEGSRKVGLTVYQNKLTESNLYIVMTQDESQFTYTGEQVRPEVTVYYGDPKEVKKAKREAVTDESTLLQTYGLEKLVPDEGKSGDYNIAGGDYILTYGTNTAAGKNKGSVTITGTDLYGGSVKVKFTILKKDVYNASK